MSNKKLTPQQRLAEAIQVQHTPFRKEVYEKETWDNPGFTKKSLLELSVKLLHECSYKEAMDRIKAGNIS